MVGISASGRTPYVLGAIEQARRGRRADDRPRVQHRLASSARPPSSPIEVVVGPEFIAGSTRLKAGTAQKLVLNMLSTLTMVRLGKTYGNLMVDVRVTNEKLRDRATRIVEQVTGAPHDEAAAALAQAGDEAKVAIVMLRAAARRRRRPASGCARRTHLRDGARRMRVAGLMSGTSFDAIDAAVADIELDGDDRHAAPARLAHARATTTSCARAELAARAATVKDVCRLDTRIGQAFAELAAARAASTSARST